MEINELTEQIIGAAIEVIDHWDRACWSRLMRNVSVHELNLRSIPFERQRQLPVEYKGVELDCGYRLDLLAANAVVVEVKSVTMLAPLHEAQLITYLRLGGWRAGLLINFNVPVLKSGIKRIVNKFEDGSEQKTKKE